MNKIFCLIFFLCSLPTKASALYYSCQGEESLKNIDVIFDRDHQSLFGALFVDNQKYFFVCNTVLQQTYCNTNDRFNFYWNNSDKTISIEDSILRCFPTPSAITIVNEPDNHE